MSLIKCPECGHPVSSQAPTCPECGIPIAGHVKRCPVCNACVQMNATECPQCHTHFIVDNEAAPTVEAEAQPPQEQKTMPQEKTKGSHTFWYLLTLFIIVVGGIVGFAYWENKTTQEAEADRAYTLLQHCNDPKNYEDFIAHYPNSEHLDDVHNRLKELQGQEKTWLDIARSADTQKLKDFVSKYPTSSHRQAALRRIDSLEWCEADKLGTSAAYNLYIEQHDAGEYITEAYAARDSALLREIQARNDSIQAALEDSMMAASPSATTVPPAE